MKNSHKVSEHAPPLILLRFPSRLSESAAAPGGMAVLPNPIKTMVQSADSVFALQNQNWQETLNPIKTTDESAGSVFALQN